jgi:hypothetical protein
VLLIMMAKFIGQTLTQEFPYRYVFVTQLKHDTREEQVLQGDLHSSHNPLAPYFPVKHYKTHIELFIYK